MTLSVLLTSKSTSMHGRSTPVRVLLVCYGYSVAQDSETYYTHQSGIWRVISRAKAAVFSRATDEYKYSLWVK